MLRENRTMDRRTTVVVERDPPVAAIEPVPSRLLLSLVARSRRDGIGRHEGDQEKQDNESGKHGLAL